MLYVLFFFNLQHSCSVMVQIINHVKCQRANGARKIQRCRPWGCRGCHGTPKLWPLYYCLPTQIWKTNDISAFNISKTTAEQLCNKKGDNKTVYFNHFANSAVWYNLNMIFFNQYQIIALLLLLLTKNSAPIQVNNLFVTSKKRNYESTNPVFTCFYSVFWQCCQR